MKPRASLVRQKIEGIGSIDLVEDIERANDGKIDSLEDWAIEMCLHESVIQEQHDHFLSSENN